MRNTSSKNIGKLERLYVLADENNIPIDENCPENIISMSVRFEDGTRIIGMSNNTNNRYTRLECMAHEMGHCMTGSFYAGYSRFEVRAKHEKKADTWAVNYIVPFGDLCQAVKEGCRECWELAELFGVSQSFIEKAITVYAQNGHTVPQELYAE